MTAPSTPPAPNDSPNPTKARSWLRSFRQSSASRWVLLLALLALGFLGYARHANRSRPLPQPGDDTGKPDAGALLEAPSAPHELSGERFLEGSIRNDLGEPLAEARVRVMSLDDPDALPRDGRSDEFGQFRVENLPHQLLAVEVSAVGHDGTERAVQPGDPSALTFVLQRQGELLVVLRDSPGNPVSETEVLLTGTGVWPAARCVADERGHCLFRALPGGQYQARARREERIALPSDSLDVTPGRRGRVDLTLQAGAQLTGRVVDRTSGKALAGVRISVVDMTPGLPAHAATSAEDGRFSLGGLWPGTMRLDATLGGYAQESHELRLPTSKALELSLEGAVRIRGRVVDERGRAIQGAVLSVSTREGLPPVALLAQAGSTATGNTAQPGELGVTQGPVPRIPLASDAAFTLGALAGTSDSGGAFLIEGLKPGSIVLRASHAGFAQAAVAQDLLLPHSIRDDIELVLRDAGRIEGRITDSKGHGLARVYVSASQSDHAEQSSLSNDRGEFTLRDLLGEVSVQIQAEGREPTLCKVNVPARGVARCDLVIAGELHELPVRVVDEYGLGLEGALISARSKTEARTYSQVSQRDGRSTLRDLPAPPYRIRVELAGYLPLLDETIEQAAREVRVTLRRAARLSGVVVDSLGTPVPHAQVSADDGEAITETDAQGTFLLPPVAPGPVTLWASHPSAGESPAREVRARPGEMLADLRLVLPQRYVEEREEEEGSHEVAGESPRPQSREKPSDLTLEQRPHAVIVSAVAAPGAAVKAGIRVGDIIAEVDGEPVLSAAHARGMLRDPAQTVARVRIVRARQTLHVRFKRPGL